MSVSPKNAETLSPPGTADKPDYSINCTKCAPHYYQPLVGGWWVVLGREVEYAAKRSCVFGERMALVQNN